MKTFCLLSASPSDKSLVQAITLCLLHLSKKKDWPLKKDLNALTAFVSDQVPGSCRGLLKQFRAQAAELGVG